MKKIIGLFCVIGLSLAPAQAENKFSKRLTQIASHLGDGGVHFSVTDSEGDLEALAGGIDQMLTSIPDMDIPPGLELKKMFKDLGLYSVHGSGASSDKKGDYWHNRLFILTDGRHEGVLSLLGKEPRTPIAAEFAPVGADLVLETTVDLREVERTTRKLARSFGRDASQNIQGALKEKLTEGGLDLATLFANFTVRGCLVVWLDDEKSFELMPGQKLPVPHVAARLDDAEMVWKVLKEQIKGESEVVEKNGEVIYYSDEEQTPFGPIRPHFVWNAAKKRLFFALTDADLATCRGKGAKLPSSGDFKAATSGFPAKNNSLAYLSQELLTVLTGAVNHMRGEFPPEADQVMDLIMPMIESMDAEAGYAAAVTTGPEGILSVINSPIPSKGSSMMGPGGVGVVAVLAGLATPAIVKAKANADKAQVINSLKMVGLALQSYGQDFDGKFPGNLRQLLKDHYLEERDWEGLGVNEMTYLPGADFAKSPASHMLAYKRLPKLSQVAVLYMDASVKAIPEEVFEQRLKAQKK